MWVEENDAKVQHYYIGEAFLVHNRLSCKMEGILWIDAIETANSHCSWMVVHALEDAISDRKVYSQQQCHVHESIDICAYPWIGSKHDNQYQHDMFNDEHVFIVWFSDLFISVVEISIEDDQSDEDDC